MEQLLTAGVARAVMPILEVHLTKTVAERTLDAIRPTLQVMGEEHNRQLTARKAKVARLTTANKGPGKKTRRPIAAKRQRRANSKPRRATNRATSKS